MKHLTRFDVKGFRGIRNLTLRNLSTVNLLVGDNNCGKTSVLESMMLLTNLESMYGTLLTSIIRDYNVINANISEFSKLYDMFPKSKLDTLTIEISGLLNDIEYEYKVTGQVKKVLIDLNTDKYIKNPYVNIYKRMLNKLNKNQGLNQTNNVETNEFHGTICNKANNKIVFEKEIELNKFLTLMDNKLIPKELNIDYVAPAEHLYGEYINNYIDNIEYKKIVLDLLKIFDKNIENILYTKSDLSNELVPSIEHKLLGVMPLYTFGDGLKRVLLLANEVAKVRGGILLIDEIETAIHNKYLEDILNFLCVASKNLDIQIFATTHSIETIDALLKVQEYDKNNDDDIVRIITLRKDNKNLLTKSRVLEGKEAYERRMDLNYEVRL